MNLRIKALMGTFAIVGCMLVSTLGVNAENTPLHDAARNGNIEEVKALCEKNHEWLSEEDNDGRTPLDCAVETKDFNLIKYLVDSGSDVNSALYVAASVEDMDLVKYFCEQPEVDINHVLFLAIHYENTEAVKSLIKQGVDVNYALFVSTSLENMDIVKYLVEEKGADVNLSIAAAASTGNIDIIKYFVEHGANVNVKDDNGVTLLQGLMDWYEICKSNESFSDECENLRISIDYLRSIGAKE